ncbi:MAG: hypothetical protein VX777_03695 [Chlamydiota bacterium]|nr:hypothetical protein [Chlamydiota bacterium]
MKYLWIMMVTVTVVIMAVFFYAYIYFPTQEAPEVVDEVNEDFSKNGSRGYDDDTKVKVGEHLDDVVIFTFNRNNPQALQRFLLDYDGMLNENILEENLRNQNYIAVLRALWSEENAQKRLEWLKKKESESHPILLFELAVEVIKEEPNLENFQKSLYYLELAKYRTDLDAVCVNDSSARAAPQSLYQTYSRAVADVVDRAPNLKNQLTQSVLQGVDKEVLTQLLSALQEIELQIDALPSPEWVSTHALRKLLSNKKIITTEKKCLDTRKRMIKSFIRNISNKLKKYNS